MIRGDTHPELPLDPDVVQPGVYRWPLHFTPLFLGIVFAGGVVGTAARYWITLHVPASAKGWPVATLFINLLGAFLLGILLEGLARLGPDSGARRVVRLTVGTGFMGAFTTYSTLANETDLLLRGSHSASGATYALVSVAGGFVSSAVGIWIAARHHRYKYKGRT